MFKVKCIKDVWTDYNSQKELDDDEVYKDVLLFKQGEFYDVEINSLGQWVTTDETGSKLHVIRDNSTNDWFENHFEIY
jgi:hypothetical protein